MDKTYVLSLLARIGLALEEGRIATAKFLCEELYIDVRDGQFVPGHHNPTEATKMDMAEYGVHLAAIQATREQAHA